MRNQNKHMVALTICKRLSHDHSFWFSLEINSETQIQFLSCGSHANGVLACKWHKIPNVPWPEATFTPWTLPGPIPYQLRAWSLRPILKADLALWEWEWARHSKGAVTFGGCKQLLLHEANVANKSKYTEWQEITEKEKIHSKWEDQAKEVEWCSPDWGVEFAQEETWVWQGSLGWGMGKEVQAEDRETEIIKLNTLTLTCTHGFSYVSLRYLHIGL